MKQRQKKEILNAIEEVSTSLNDVLDIKEAVTEHIENKKTEIESLEEKKSVLELKVSELENKMDMASQLSAKDKEIFFLNEKIRSCESEKTAHVSSENILNLSLNATKEYLAQSEYAKHELWEKIHTLQGDSDKLTDLKQSFELIKNERDLLAKKITALSAQLKSTITENVALKWKIDSTKETLDDLKCAKKEKDHDCVTLEQSVTRLNTDLSGLQHDEKDMLERLSSLESQLKETTLAKNNADNELASKKEEVKTMSSKIIELEKIAKPNQGFASKIEALEAEKKRLLDKTASLEVSKVRMDGNLAATKKALDEFKFIQRNLNSRLEEKAKRALEADRLELRNKNLEKEKANALAQCDDLFSQINSCRESKKILENDLKVIQGALEEARQEILILKN